MFGKNREVIPLAKLSPSTDSHQKQLLETLPVY
jgi:hypothetical protein